MLPAYLSELPPLLICEEHYSTLPAYLFVLPPFLVHEEERFLPAYLEEKSRLPTSYFSQCHHANCCWRGLVKAEATCPLHGDTKDQGYLLGGTLSRGNSVAERSLRGWSWAKAGAGLNKRDLPHVIPVWQLAT